MRKANRRQTNKASSAKPGPSSPPHLATMTTIADDPILGYKLRVLLYDFRNITKDPASARRLNATTDEHYISAPYFDQEQAQVIKAAIVDSYLSQQHAPNTPDVGNTNHVETAGSCESLVAVQGQPFDTAVRALFNNHLDKRRASGDARPCGPHDLAPRYEALFGIRVKEIEEEETGGDQLLESFAAQWSLERSNASQDVQQARSASRIPRHKMAVYHLLCRSKSSNMSGMTRARRGKLPGLDSHGVSSISNHQHLQVPRHLPAKQTRRYHHGETPEFHGRTMINHFCKKANGEMGFWGDAEPHGRSR